MYYSTKYLRDRAYRFLMIAIVLCASAGVDAKTYYLAPNGSDWNSRNGSSGSPWKTIQYAMSRMANGDDLRLKAGTYRYDRTQKIYRSGSSNNWVTIQADSGAEVVLDYANNNTQWTDAVLITGNYVSFKNINVRGNNRGGGIIMSGHHITINNCDVYNHGGPAIQAFGNTSNWNNTPNQIKIEWCNVWNTCRMNDPGFWNYQGWADIGGFWPFAVGGRNARNVKIYNCWVGENFGEGIVLNRIRGGSSEIRNCKARDNYSVNIYVDGATGSSSNWVDVHNNITESTGKTRFYRGGYPAQNIVVASELYDDLTGNNFTNRVYLYGNTAKKGVNNFAVAYFDGDVSNVTFNKNVSVNPTYNHFLQDDSSKIKNINVLSNNSWK